MFERPDAARPYDATVASAAPKVGLKHFRVEPDGDVQVKRDLRFRSVGRVLWPNLTRWDSQVPYGLLEWLRINQGGTSRSCAEGRQQLEGSWIMMAIMARVEFENG